MRREFNVFLQTNDGLIAGKFIIRIGPLELWPHGFFHKVSYQHGEAAFQTHAAEEDVQDFLDEAEE